MGLKASETYKSSMENSTYTHCLKKKDLLDLMVTFPDAKSIFMKRAALRRIEFRRIKKQFEKFANVDVANELEGKEEINNEKFAIHWYSDKSNAE